MNEILVKKKNIKKYMNASRSTGIHDSIKSIERGCWIRQDSCFHGYSWTTIDERRKKKK